MFAGLSLTHKRFYQQRCELKYSRAKPCYIILVTCRLTPASAARFPALAARDVERPTDLGLLLDLDAKPLQKITTQFSLVLDRRRVSIMGI